MSGNAIGLLIVGPFVLMLALYGLLLLAENIEVWLWQRKHPGEPLPGDSWDDNYRMD